MGDEVDGITYLDCVGLYSWGVRFVWINDKSWKFYSFWNMDRASVDLGLIGGKYIALDNYGIE